MSTSSNHSEADDMVKSPRGATQALKELADDDAGKEPEQQPTSPKLPKTPKLAAAQLVTVRTPKHTTETFGTVDINDWESIISKPSDTPPLAYRISRPWIKTPYNTPTRPSRSIISQSFTQLTESNIQIAEHDSATTKSTSVHPNTPPSKSQLPTLFDSTAVEHQELNNPSFSPDPDSNSEISDHAVSHPLIKEFNISPGAVSLSGRKGKRIPIRKVLGEMVDSDLGPMKGRRGAKEWTGE